MSILDPNIILGAGNQNDPAKANALRQQAMQIHEEQKRAQSQNALKKLMATPGSVDPKTGQLSPQAMQQMMAIDPDTAMKWHTLSLDDQVKQLEAYHDRTEIGAKQFDMVGKAYSSSVDAYNAAKKAGRSDEDAVSAARAARNEVVNGAGGLLGDDKIQQIESSPWEITKATALAGTDKEWMTERNTDRHLTDQEQHEAAREREEDARIAAMLGRQQRDPTATKWVVETDPTTKKQFRYNPDTAEATTLDGKPYTPGGVEKIPAPPKPDDHWKVVKDKDGTEYRFNPDTDQATTLDGKPYTIKGAADAPGSGGQPRSGQALAVKKYMQEHPDATAQDIQRFIATGQGLSKAARDWATGPQGNTARSLDVAVSHIQVLDDLVKGLKNGDVNLLNAAKNRFTQEFGGEAPNDFNAAKGIVSDEILKAVLGSGAGSQADREELQKQFSAAQSPEQLEGVIRTAEKLMSGQLQGLRRQYKRTTGGDDFDDNFLSDQTRKVLEDGGDGSSKKPGSGGGSDYRHLWGN